MLYTILSRRAALALALAGGNIAGCSGSVAAGSHICHLGSNLADRRQSYKVVEAELFSLTPVVPCFSLAQGVLISFAKLCQFFISSELHYLKFAIL